jgi:hypothetical protein
MMAPTYWHGSGGHVEEGSFLKPEDQILQEDKLQTEDKSCTGTGRWRERKKPRSYAGARYSMGSRKPSDELYVKPISYPLFLSLDLQPL